MDLKQYKQQQQKVVTAPSGLQFTIRKIPTKMLIELMASLPPENADQALRAQLPSFLAKLLPNCIINPKVVDGPSDENSLSLDELTPEDAMFLLTEIMEFSGITGAAAEERRKFR